MSANEFAVISELKGQTMSLQVSGAITVASVFPNLTRDGVAELVLDLGKVKYINSAGVRRWMLWVWNIEKTFEDIPLYIENVPAILVKQMATVKEFMPSTAVTRNFFVSYYCPDCDESTDRRFDSNSDFADKSMETVKATVISGAKCPTCSKQMEVDSVPEHYIFLVKSK